MLQFKLIRKTSLTTASLFLLFISGVAQASDPIGDIVESTGIGSILRNNVEIPHQPDTEIVLNDEARTGNGRMMIEFLDKAQLSLREHSEVLIDEIYYDPNPSLSKMSMKFTMGTARFASGRLGLVNKANIDISTPTASIAVRGTDFTTTVDELGRSLVILLPDINGDPSGEIVVSNEGGEVILNQAYAATMVSSLDQAPPPPACPPVTVSVTDCHRLAHVRILSSVKRMLISLLVHEKNQRLEAVRWVD